MRKILTAVAVVVALLAGAVPASAQAYNYQPPTKPFSEKLGWVGIFTMMGGALVMVPWKTEPGAEDWNLLGEDVCVITQYQGEYGANGNKFDIQHHPCDSTTPMIKGGLITLGIGGALALVGFHKVAIKPTLSPQVVGATVSVKW